MAYGATRFLYNNLITDVSMITAGSQATGVVSGVEKTRGTGAAIMFAVGAFTGDSNLDYTAQIDSVAIGVSVGQATFRWKTSESVGWEATGVTTTSALQTLNNGVQVAWVASDSGADFTASDTFQWFATARFGTIRLLDLNPNTLFRSGATFPVVIDLGSAKNITALALYNHNLTAGVSTLTLQGNATNSWGAPSYSQAVTVTNNHIAYYLNQTYRYWRIVPVDGALSYFQASGLYLGTYFEPSCNPWWGSVDSRGYTVINNDNPAGIYTQKAHAKQRRLTLNWDILDNTELGTIITMQEALISATTGRISPVFVHLFSDETDRFFLCDWKNINQMDQTFRSYLQNRNLSLEFFERVITRT